MNPASTTLRRGPDQDYIRGMFDAFAPRYETFTRLIGMGQDDRLRRQALRDVRPGWRVLDLACGTGQLTFLAARRAGPTGQVLGIDLSPGMIAQAQRRQAASGIAGPALSFEVRRGEDLPDGERRYDLIVSAYALRNLYENIDVVLRGLRESLVPGGGVALLDLTEPVHPVLRTLYRGYFYGLVGLYGKALFGKDYPVTYLPDSAQRFFKAHEFTAALERAGFKKIQRQGYFLGAVTLYRAVRA
ncbi:MAG: Demethylmenaquinone methyltransferase [Candidatus Omnitrophica bacterium]|nr:Demethylmenaquinone methyltransferase [Candidatus Omnitrophota bacterium]